MLAERKLTPFQGLLHAIWTDERISSSCVSMNNTDHIRINADAARRFKPVKAADLRQLRGAARLMARRSVPTATAGVPRRRAPGPSLAT